jgi:hypothetical protein
LCVRFGKFLRTSGRHRRKRGEKNGKNNRHTTPPMARNESRQHGVNPPAYTHDGILSRVNASVQ